MRILPQELLSPDRPTSNIWEVDARKDFEHYLFLQTCYLSLRRGWRGRYASSETKLTVHELKNATAGFGYQAGSLHEAQGHTEHIPELKLRGVPARVNGMRLAAKHSTCRGGRHKRGCIMHLTCRRPWYLETFQVHNAD